MRQKYDISRRLPQVGFFGADTSDRLGESRFDASSEAGLLTARSYFGITLIVAVMFGCTRQSLAIQSSRNRCVVVRRFLERITEAVPQRRAPEWL